MALHQLVEARNKLKAKQDDLGKVFAEARSGPDGTIDLSKVRCLGENLSSQQITEKIRALNKECEDLGKEVDSLVEVEKAEQATRGREEKSQRNPADPPQPSKKELKSLGDMFVESRAFKEFKSGSGPAALIADGVSLKTLFETGAGWAPESVRTGRVVDFATRPVQVTDILPMGRTGQALVKFMEETTFTNAAAETAEGGSYPEAALELTEKNSPVEKIAVFLPVTDEQFEDEPRARSYVDNRLPFMLRQRLDLQILVGDGTSPNLRGINNVVGIQTQAKGADPVPDAIHKAMTKVRVTGRAMPNAIILHPNDWQDIRLLRTSDGIYIWGSPSDAAPERIWGVRVVQSDAQTENTGIVGDFANYSELVERTGIEVLVSNSHSDFFVKGKLAIRASMRSAVVWYRPAAFATVTGI